MRQTNNFTEDKNLKQALLKNVQWALLDFNNTFGLVAINQKVFVDGRWGIIDLLFYHVLLKCYVIVNIQDRELRQGDMEQVNQYLTYLKAHKVPGDRDPIALIICKSHNKIDVYYSAGKDRDDIFVAEYKTRLPSEEEIKRKLKKLK